MKEEEQKSQKDNILRILRIISIVILFIIPMIIAWGMLQIGTDVFIAAAGVIVSVFFMLVGYNFDMEVSK